jgi:hypothetical protein
MTGSLPFRSLLVYDVSRTQNRVVIGGKFSGVRYLTGWHWRGFTKAFAWEERVAPIALVSKASHSIIHILDPTGRSPGIFRREDGCWEGQGRTGKVSVGRAPLTDERPRQAVKNRRMPAPAPRTRTRSCTCTWPQARLVARNRNRRRDPSGGEGRRAAPRNPPPTRTDALQPPERRTGPEVTNHQSVENGALEISFLTELSRLVLLSD